MTRTIHVETADGRVELVLRTLDVETHARMTPELVSALERELADTCRHLLACARPARLA